MNVVYLCDKSLGTQGILALFFMEGTEMLLIAKLRTVSSSIGTKDENCIFITAVSNAAFCLRRRLFSFDMPVKEAAL